MPVAPAQAAADGAADVRYHAVSEEVLLAALHLDDEVVAALVGAVDVEDDVLLELAVADLLLRQVADVGDEARVGGKRLVEERDEELLVVLGSENTLEAEISQGVDEIGGVVL